MPQSWDDVAETVQFTAPLNLSAFIERVPPDAEVLDLGCGYGRVASQLASAGFKNIRGYDASEKMIQRAKTQHPQLRLNIADAAMLPDRDHSIGAVVASALLTSIPEAAKRQAVIREIRRVLKPGGTIHGVEFLRREGVAYANGGIFESKAGIAMWHFQPDELERLFARFTGWQSWREHAPSLSGGPSPVLQFVACAA